MSRLKHNRPRPLVARIALLMLAGLVCSCARPEPTAEGAEDARTKKDKPGATAEAAGKKKRTPPLTPPRLTAH